MRTDPIETRRRGLHRLRMVTASMVAAAVIGTGALTWTVAADETNGATTESAGTSDTTNSDTTTPQAPSFGTTLGRSDSGHADASSGGS
jgi:hypothetical protein